MKKISFLIVVLLIGLTAVKTMSVEDYTDYVSEKGYVYTLNVKNWNDITENDTLIFVLDVTDNTTLYNATFNVNSTTNPNFFDPDGFHVKNFTLPEGLPENITQKFTILLGRYVALFQIQAGYFVNEIETIEYYIRFSENESWQFFDQISFPLTFNIPSNSTLAQNLTQIQNNPTYIYIDTGSQLLQDILGWGAVFVIGVASGGGLYWLIKRRY